MENVKMNFIDGWDYLDFAWFLDSYDTTKQADNHDIEKIYTFYKELVESHGTGDNVRNYLEKQLKNPVIVCPHCSKLFNVYAFPYQVNNNFELTLCSYDCSEKYTVKNLQILLDDGLTFKEIAEGI